MPFCRVDLFGAVFELWLKSYQQVKNTIYRDHLLRAKGENIHGGKHRGGKKQITGFINIHEFCSHIHDHI